MTAIKTVEPAAEIMFAIAGSSKDMGKLFGKPPMEGAHGMLHRPGATGIGPGQDVRTFPMLHHPTHQPRINKIMATAGISPPASGHIRTLLDYDRFLATGAKYHALAWLIQM